MINMIENMTKMITRTGWVGWCVVGWVGWWAGGKYIFWQAGGGGGSGGRGVEEWKGIGVERRAMGV